MNQNSLEDHTVLSDAVRILVRSGIDANHETMRVQLREGRLRGRKVGNQYFVLNSEIDRILKEEQA